MKTKSDDNDVFAINGKTLVFECDALSKEARKKFEKEHRNDNVRVRCNVGLTWRKIVFEIKVSEVIKIIYSKRIIDLNSCNEMAKITVSEIKCAARINVHGKKINIDNRNTHAECPSCN